MGDAHYTQGYDDMFDEPAARRGIGCSSETAKLKKASYVASKSQIMRQSNFCLGGIPEGALESRAALANVTIKRSNTDNYRQRSYWRTMDSLSAS